MPHKVNYCHLPSSAVVRTVHLTDVAGKQSYIIIIISPPKSSFLCVINFHKCTSECYNGSFD